MLLGSAADSAQTWEDVMSSLDASATTELRMQTAFFEFTPNLARFRSLTSIDMSGCGRTNTPLQLAPVSVPESMFAGCNALTSIKLANCPFESVPEGLFRGLPLTSLDMAGCGIESVPEGLFRGLPLTSLDMGGNLHSVPSGLFAGLTTTLTSLDLSSCGLTALPAGLFAGCHALTFLSLSHSLFNTRVPEWHHDVMPEGIFAGLIALTEIDLSHCESLTWLPDGLLHGLVALTSVKLSNCENLVSLPAGLFAGLTGLTSIRLNDCNLGSLPEGIFAGLLSLTTIDLSYNALTSLPVGLFAGLTALASSNLSSADFSLPEGLFDGLPAINSIICLSAQMPSGMLETLLARGIRCKLGSPKYEMRPAASSSEMAVTYESQRPTETAVARDYEAEIERRKDLRRAERESAQAKRRAAASSSEVAVTYESQRPTETTAVARDYEASAACCAAVDAEHAVHRAADVQRALDAADLVADLLAEMPPAEAPPVEALAAETPPAEEHR